MPAPGAAPCSWGEARAAGQQGRAVAHLGFTSSQTACGSSWDVGLGEESWEPGPKPELLLPVDPGHLSHIQGSLQEKRSQLG